MSVVARLWVARVRMKIPICIGGIRSCIFVAPTLLPFIRPLSTWSEMYQVAFPVSKCKSFCGQIYSMFVVSNVLPSISCENIPISKQVDWQLGRQAGR